MAGFHSGIDVGNVGQYGSRNRNLLDLTSSSSSNSKTTGFHSVNAHAVHKKEEQTMVAGTRWNPAPEQVQALEEMYRCGLRTPTAHQIQQIASQLTRFGKIQGKNVFYWFQNHKARERQKRRRELQLANEQPKHLPTLQQQCCFEKTMQPAPAALKRTCADLNSNRGRSLTHSRDSAVYMQRAAVTRNGSKWVGGGETTVDRRHVSWQLVQLSPGHLQFLHPMEFPAANNIAKIDGITGKKDVAERVETLQLFPITNDESWSQSSDDQGYTDFSSNIPKPVKYFQFL